MKVYVVLSTCDCEADGCWGYSGVEAVYASQQTAQQHADRSASGCVIHTVTVSTHLPDYLNRRGRK